MHLGRRERLERLYLGVGRLRPDYVAGMPSGRGAQLLLVIKVWDFVHVLGGINELEN